MPEPVLHPIFVDPKAPIKINVQIAEQIKLLIAMGDLQFGDALPTVTQLAKHLGVNHNTIATVYNDLIESGYLVAQRGKGTFVAHTQVVQNILTRKHFYNLLGQAFTAGAQVGLNASKFCAAAYAQAVRLSRVQKDSLKLVFVENLQHSADIYEAIQAEIELSLLFLPLEDLDASHPKTLIELLSADFIITTGKHLWEVTQVTAPEQEVMAIDVKPDPQLVIQISSLPRHAKILLVCQEEGWSKAMKQMLEQAGISHVSLQAVDLKYIQQNRQVLEQFDVVYASRLVEKYVRQYSLQPNRVMVFNVSIDRTNMLVLKARLAAIQ
ncbi:MAG: GntR family transcriptional regulator [Symploca sp. SIO1B1]|nr:GntR family transcriptional regulator [Symploca sp. SIO1B1]